jgi:hypothetical protein
MIFCGVAVRKILSTKSRHFLIVVAIIITLGVILTNVGKNKTEISAANIDSECGVLPISQEGGHNNLSASDYSAIMGIFYNAP